MKITGRFLVWASVALGPLGAPAQVLNLGPEFPVNTFTTSGQLFPAVAASSDGSFVVVWDSSFQGDAQDVFGQRFNPFGVKAGAEFPVNTYTIDDQRTPIVAMDAQGNFVVVWESAYQDGSGTGLYAQRFDASGAKAGAEFRVNTETGGDQQAAAIAMRPSGEFVVVWSGGYSDLSDETAQIFDAAGAKIGAPFTVNTYTTDNQRAPAVAIDPAGDFVVVWGSDAEDGDQFGVFGQKFNAAGQKVGPSFQVNTYTTGDQDYPAIAMDGAGNFVVVWTSLDGQDGSSTGVFGQRFNSGAEKVGPEFPVNAFTASQQLEASIALEPDGGFLVAWRSFSQDGSDFGVFGQRFDRLGARRGPEFQINTYTTSFQGQVGVAAAQAGPLAVWASEGADGDNFAIRGRRQRLQPVALLADAHVEGNSDANGVIEPGEAVRIEPTWGNRGPGIANLDGTVSATDFGGPPGPTYALSGRPRRIPDDARQPDGDLQRAPRPLLRGPGVRNAAGGALGRHDDGNPLARRLAGLDAARRRQLRGRAAVAAVLQEDRDASAQAHHVGLHGDGVLSRPPRLAGPDGDLHRKGIAGAGEYVPDGRLSERPAVRLLARRRIAVRRRRRRRIASAATSTTSARRTSRSAAPRRSIAPTRPSHATRWPSFIAKALVAPGSGNAVPISYTDPTTSRSYSCISGSANLHFSDVPVSNAFCKHIHFLWAKGIVDGCTATTYCPGQPVARDAMAKFLANGFGLQLYGP